MTADNRPLGWDAAQAADEYRDRDMRLARDLIFPVVLRRIGPSPGPDHTALDIGCGTGAVAGYLAENAGWSVRGLDPSPHMLDIARADRSHPNITYQLFDGRHLEQLADDSVAAAVCCLVYCTDSDDARLAALTAEIRRVLRPGAPYVLADLNPDAVGTTFSTLRYGDPGATYAHCDPVPTALRRLDGTMLTATCYYRPLSSYRAFLANAGFSSPTVELPTLSADSRTTDGPEPAETRTAPYLILTVHA